MTKQNQITEDMIYDSIRNRVSKQEPKPVSKKQSLSKDEAMGEALNVMKQYFATEGENIEIQGQGQEAQRNVLAQVATVGMAYLDEIGVAYEENDIQELITNFAKELDNGD